jgi:hypothetical protein
MAFPGIAVCLKVHSFHPINTYTLGKRRPYLHGSTKVNALRNTYAASEEQRAAIHFPTKLPMLAK